MPDKGTARQCDPIEKKYQADPGAPAKRDRNVNVIVWPPRFVGDEYGQSKHQTQNGSNRLGGVPIRFKAIASGLEYSFLAVKLDGTVVGWGQNSYGAATVPPDLTNVIAVSEEYYSSLALKSDGTIAAWGYNSDGQLMLPSGLSNVVS